MLNYTYLATEADLASFNPNDFAKYQYVALFGLGKYAKEVSINELYLIKANLARFMTDKCLVVSAMELDATPKDSFIRILFDTTFSPSPELEAYVAIATVFPGVNEQLHLTPEYQKLEWDSDSPSRYPICDALNQCREHLRAKVIYSSLEEIKLPFQLSKQQPMACPYGAKIKEMRGSKSIFQICQEKVPLKTGTGTFQLARTTLTQAENNEPITLEKLKDIACYFNVPVSAITFEKVVPCQRCLQELRAQTGMDKESLAHIMGLPSGYFFDLLETAESVPSEKMRFIHKQFIQILKLKNKDLKFGSLLNISATEALASGV